ncbi:MAG: hypothetical protein K5695_03270 [Oscillospiraceae bacterium]|nr:hypothetical protein [Oscillospiraceae bacterium]
MKKLIYTDNIGFDMDDWLNQPIKKVFAGTDCIMAVTEDGRTLQKIRHPRNAAAVIYWTRIQEIALSAWFPGLAIGLVSDGTCLIAKKPTRNAISLRNQIPFEIVNNKIKSWKHIVQVAVSDAFFALTDDGRVHYAALERNGEEDYRDVLSWRNVRRIVVGMQCSIIGITHDGQMLCAGHGLRKGPNGDVTERLAACHDVTDACISGSECEEIVIARKDGTVESITGHGEPIFGADGKEKMLRSHFGYYYYMLDAENHLFMKAYGAPKPVFPDDPLIDSFAVGDIGYSEPFVIATGSPRQ